MCVDVVVIVSAKASVFSTIISVNILDNKVAAFQLYPFSGCQLGFLVYCSVVIVPCFVLPGAKENSAI